MWNSDLAALAAYERRAERSQGSALEWLGAPITKDGSGYVLRSPAGAEREISPEERVAIVCQNDKLIRIEALARRHNHPGCNTGAQTLAGLIVKICEEK